MHGLAAAVLVTLVLVLVILLVGLPLIKSIMEAKIQLALIAERASQHRQQTTIMLAGIVAFVLIALYLAHLRHEERQQVRNHELEVRRLETERQAQLPPPPVQHIYIQAPSRRQAYQQVERVGHLIESPDELVVIPHRDRKELEG